MRPGSKHLCGQTCLHKLMDDFMARDVASRMQRGAADDVELEERAEGTDASLTSDAAYVEFESSARLITPPAPSLPKQVANRAGTGLVAMPARVQAAALASPSEETPSYRSRTWRSEAWEREREREMRAVERRPDIAARRRSSS
jgi:hypothetical protein